MPSSQHKRKPAKRLFEAQWTRSASKRLPLKAAKSCATTRHGTGTARGIRAKRNQLNKNGVVPMPDQAWQTSRRQVLNLWLFKEIRTSKERRSKRCSKKSHEWYQQSQMQRGFWTLAAIHQRPRKRNPLFDFRDRSRHEVLIPLNPRETSRLIHLFKFRQGKVS